jgi:hypothetical protein
VGALEPAPGGSDETVRDSGQGRYHGEHTLAPAHLSIDIEGGAVETIFTVEDGASELEDDDSPFIGG